ncbi:unnamed protein product [Brassica oleracea var. botrytis]
MDQLTIMMNSADSHHQKPRSITKSSSSFRVCCTDLDPKPFLSIWLQDDITRMDWARWKLCI